MPFGVAAAAVGAGAAIYGASKQSKATKQAADQSAEVQREGIAFQKEALDQLRGDLEPYRGAGVPALGAMQNAAGLNGPDGYAQALAAFQASPGYQFQFDEGMRAVNAGAAASGMSQSGAALKALQARGQQLANQDFGTYYNRLAGLAQIGQNSAAQSGAAGVQTAGGVANSLAGIGQTYASLGTAQANIQGNMVQGVGNAVGQGLNSLYGAYRANSLYEPPPAAGVY